MNVKDLKLSPGQWLVLLQRYGVDAASLTGHGAPCPMCGGSDRFTYDNKCGRGDWICRQCDNGEPQAGDGLALICKFTGMKFGALMQELSGGSLNDLKSTVYLPAAPKPKHRADRAFIEHRLTKLWGGAHQLSEGDLVTRYLAERIPGLNVSGSESLRLGMLEYWHDKKLLGSWPGIVARFELPDGRLGTLHRTFLERSAPQKARIVSSDGEILDVKRNDKTLNPLDGGAVRLMDPVNGEVGVAEGLETAYAAHMLFKVPTWYCLNSGLLTKFQVPDGLNIRTVHIFMDFDDVDPKTKKSPGVHAGNSLAKRLRSEGYTVLLHRPRLRGTDFVDEWKAKCHATDAVTRSVPAQFHGSPEVRRAVV